MIANEWVGMSGYPVFLSGLAVFGLFLCLASLALWVGYYRKCSRSAVLLRYGYQLLLACFFGACLLLGLPLRDRLYRSLVIGAFNLSWAPLLIEWKCVGWLVGSLITRRKGADKGAPRLRVLGLGDFVLLAGVTVGGAIGMWYVEWCLDRL
jgi:hypothetical protein